MRWICGANKCPVVFSDATPHDGADDRPHCLAHGDSASQCRTDRVSFSAAYVPTDVRPDVPHHAQPHRIAIVQTGPELHRSLRRLRQHIMCIDRQCDHDAIVQLGDDSRSGQLLERSDVSTERDDGGHVGGARARSVALLRHVAVDAAVVQRSYLCVDHPGPRAL